jgi:hypothetical protein
MANEIRILGEQALAQVEAVTNRVERLELNIQRLLARLAPPHVEPEPLSIAVAVGSQGANSKELMQVQKGTFVSDGLSDYYETAAATWGTSSWQADQQAILLRNPLNHELFAIPPCTDQVVQIYDGGEAAGAWLTPNGDGYLPGRVVSFASAAATVHETVWILPLDDLGTTQLQNHEYYPGRLFDSPTSAGSKRAVYAVRRGEALEVVEFELTATLSLGSTAAAKIKTCGGSDGDAITVADYHPSPGKYSGVSGFQGFAVKTECGNYAILSMDRYARIMEAELTADMAAGSASATRLDYYDGRDPGASGTVYDPLGLHSDLVTGEKCNTVWDDIENRYKVIDSPKRDRRALYGVAVNAWVKVGRYVDVHPCADIGGNTPDTGTTHRVYWTGSTARTPNVIAGQVVVYHLGTDGLYATTDHLDDPIGRVGLWVGTVASIPQGWAVMDSSDNSSPGSGIDLVGHTVRGKTGTDAADDTAGGNDSRTPADHPAADIAAALLDHDDHAHAVDRETGVDHGEGAETLNNVQRTGAVENVGGGGPDGGVLGHTGSSTDVSHDEMDVTNLFKGLHFIERMDNSYVAP